MKKAAAVISFPAPVPGRCCATVTRRAFGRNPARAQCHWPAAFEVDGLRLCRSHYDRWLKAQARDRE